MLDSHFFAKHRAGGATGYTWTLASLLSDMLEQAETCFGPRDHAWALLGVEFGPGPQPHNWHPGFAGGARHVIIQLTTGAAEDRWSAMYQLAHEVIHVLSPAPDMPGLCIEEGVADEFRDQYLIKFIGGDAQAWLAETASAPGRIQQYAAAQADVKKLLAIDAHAIYKLRQVQPCFKRMTPATFEAAGIAQAVGAELIDSLLAEFASSTP